MLMTDNDLAGSDLTAIESYVITLAASAIEDVAEDDIDEEGLFDGSDDHTEAMKLAMDIAKLIRACPRAVLDLVAMSTAMDIAEVIRACAEPPTEAAPV